MKRSAHISYCFSCLLATMLVACSEFDAGTLSEDFPDVPLKEYNDFDFSTTNEDFTLKLQYTLEQKAPVYFELYDQMPIEDNGEGNSYNKVEGLMPLFTGMTDSDGNFSQKISLPAYVTKLFIFSPAFYAPTILTADVTGSSATVTYDYKSSRARASRLVATTTKEHYTKVLTNNSGNYADCPWKDWLVEFDKTANGHVTNLTTDRPDLMVTNASELFSVHQAVMNVQGTCPEEYRSYADLLVNETSEVAITFIGGNTCWSSSLGYYYYPEGQKPASLKEANVILIFPNTQNGAMKYKGFNPNNGVDWDAYGQAGINTGDCVQLKYYPHIKEGSREGETYVFPAGYRIGLVLATNAWTNRVPGWGQNDKIYRAATSEGLSVPLSSNAPFTTIDEVQANPKDAKYYKRDPRRTAKYTYNGQTLISFEDHTDDLNMSDVIVALKSNPVKALIDPDDPNNIVNITIENTTTIKGVYTFEDLWPNQGDYDLNDVGVQVSYTKTTNQWNQVLTESYIFKLCQNYASLQNGLAARVSGLNNDVVTYFMRKAGEEEFTEIQLSMESDGVVLLTDDVKKYPEAEFMIKVNHRDLGTKEKIDAVPFIYREEEDGLRWEVHITGDKPSTKMNTKYFGQGNDATNPAGGIYYVRNGDYPFGLNFSGATYDDIKDLFSKENEGKPIETVFPDYRGWVQSKGINFKDWFKSKLEDFLDKWF